MKYFVVGMHASGKREIINLLEKWGVKCAHLFSNQSNRDETIYDKQVYDIYDSQEVNSVFENNAYMFIQEKVFEGEHYFEGLTKYAFENSDVICLEPNQLIEMSMSNIKEKICFIWLDNTRTNRYNRYKEENRQYNFNVQENQENTDNASFIQTIYNYPVMYFNNEVPSRIASIIYGIIKHPDLYNIFIENFN